MFYMSKITIFGNLNQVVNTNIKDVPNFIRISLSSIKKLYLKNTHELVSTKLGEGPLDILFIYYHQTIFWVVRNKHVIDGMSKLNKPNL